ncbi:hypothetical protein OUZ56_031303 [Daphnia magna]|uniref:Uncharacterized protein n=1 Tax=Daphnia magna TaxID=35525 RepID=A0ABQ9ZTZ6_9CRUS|nr:hypothetical protein OUZ56_031303 [Daphnia magna]
MPTKSIYTQLGGCEGCVDIAVNTAEQEHETTACTVLGRPCCQYDRSSCQNSLLPASLSQALGNLPGESIEAVSPPALVDSNF